MCNRYEGDQFGIVKVDNGERESLHDEAARPCKYFGHRCGA
jgi:hypothetical protein